MEQKKEVKVSGDKREVCDLKIMSHFYICLFVSDDNLLVYLNFVFQVLALGGLYCFSYMEIIILLF